MSCLLRVLHLISRNVAVRVSSFRATRSISLVLNHHFPMVVK